MTGSAFSEREGAGSFIEEAFLSILEEQRREGQRARDWAGSIAWRMAGSAFSEGEGGVSFIEEAFL
eukprot:7181408-Pyramimonas_sp.AAC.1